VSPTQPGRRRAGLRDTGEGATGMLLMPTGPQETANERSEGRILWSGRPPARPPSSMRDCEGSIDANGLSTWNGAKATQNSFAC
jgi:hypothetical protein